MTDSHSQWLWALWHTRPGHKPTGVIYDRHFAACTACGSKAPR